MLSRVAFAFDRIGLRPLVAKAASLAYSDQSFSVDSDGHWVSQQSECTVVSPTIHTTSYAFFREITLKDWCRDYQPKAGDTVVDLGSGVGEEVVILSELVGPSGRVVAVEAHPETYQCLVQTVVRSELTNVTPVHCAIADVDGTAVINTTDNHLANSIFAGEGERVPEISLETLCRDVTQIDFLRSNIEGAERLAIRGPALAKVLNACVSCHDFAANDGQGEHFRTSAEVRAALEEAGFSISEGLDAAGKPWLQYYLYAERLPASGSHILR